jgi:serine/threonine protein kinase
VKLIVDAVQSLFARPTRLRTEREREAERGREREREREAERDEDVKSVGALRGWSNHLGLRYCSDTLSPLLSLRHLTTAAALSLSPTETASALSTLSLSLPITSLSLSLSPQQVYDIELPLASSFLSLSGSLLHNCTGLATVQAANVLKRLKEESTELRDGDVSFSAKSRADAALTWRRNRRFHAKSTVGTPDYIAPEVFEGRAYDERVDWWSAGCILYEMLVGYPPFAAESPAETYRKIVHHSLTLQWPRESAPTPSVVHLVSSLLCEYEGRLPLGGIKEHEWFSGVEWGGVRKSRAVFVPQLSSPADTSYFDEQPETEPPPTLATVFPPPPSPSSSSSSSSSSLLSPRPSDARSRRPKDPVAARWSTTHLSFVGFTYRAFPQKVRRDEK